VAAVCGLAFTIGSFWWLHARQGSLKLYEPQSFAACASPQLLLLRLPLVMYNTGAKPIVVQDLRLRFPTEPEPLLPLPWRTSRTQLMPKADDGHSLPSAFAVAGRDAQQVFIEFGAPIPGFTPEDRNYSVQVEARLGHRKGWRPVLTFTWRAGRISTPALYIPYSNAPHDVTRDEVRQANAALNRLSTDLARGTQTEAEE
jgi:hypothetical protein